MMLSVGWLQFRVEPIPDHVGVSLDSHCFLGQLGHKLQIAHRMKVPKLQIKA